MPPATVSRTNSLELVSGESENGQCHAADKKSTSLIDAQLRSKGYHAEADKYWITTQIARMLCFIVTALCVFYSTSIQTQVDLLWAYLQESHIFRSAYFETGYVTVVFGLVIGGYPFAMHYIPFLQRFKISNDVTYVHQTMFDILMSVVVYMTPLLAADAVIMKRYWDVPEEEWTQRRQQWIQTTRALPEDAPPFLLMCCKVIGSVIIFDAQFFIIHYLMHKNLLLYKYLHAEHHDHQIMHAHVTNKLSVIERLLLIVSANYALKLFRCHPLTRIVYVPVFLWLLVENHSGYDLPWAPHRLMPKGLMGGPVKHYAHHLQGSRHYQPFFNYLDNWLEKFQFSKKKL